MYTIETIWDLTKLIHSIIIYILIPINILSILFCVKYCKKHKIIIIGILFIILILLFYVFIDFSKPFDPIPPF